MKKNHTFHLSVLMIVFALLLGGYSPAATQNIVEPSTLTPPVLEDSIVALKTGHDNRHMQSVIFDNTLINEGFEGEWPPTGWEVVQSNLSETWK